MISGVSYRELPKNSDNRGWLSEMHRNDNLSELERPAMSYVSMTLPGSVRGPHEHIEQTDRFVFLGTSCFEIFLWDNNPYSSTYRNNERVYAPKGKLFEFIISPRVVHGYKNVGCTDGLVLNLPNRLYGGKDKKEEVDEVRHEDDIFSKFKI